MTIKFTNSPKFDKRAAILLVDKTKKVSKVAASLIPKTFTADEGEIFPVVKNNTTILLVGIGAKKELSLTSLRILVKKALLSPYLSKVEDIEVISSLENDTHVEAIIEAVLIGTYVWRKYKTKQEEDKSVYNKNIFIAVKKKKPFEDRIKICEGVNFARDLVNDNADTVTASYVEETIKNITKDSKNITLEILGKKELKVAGLNLHLAVNQGSNKDPKLIVIKYAGGTKKDKYQAIIGKGVTYDTGGLNLKPTGYMESMRQDMGGTAAVVGTLKNTIALNLKKNILFVCGLAENTIGPDAYKPGDVIKSYSGKTVEVANTDAEGRLVLADAISYINKNYSPSKIIDIATLTGAVSVALANDYTGLVSTDDVLANKLLRSAHKTDDRAWRLPNYKELADSVKSQIADIKNTGYPKGTGGTITAAEFLRQFAHPTKWAHLDIAGAAFVESGERMYFGYGATGAGVRLLTDYLMK
ncbi:MAG: leucyl aminopeptidase [Candidatus Zapsychrus exili]|nr:leucyl aminopeptidase [Candidatus Zapsychrus exili]